MTNDARSWRYTLVAGLALAGCTTQLTQHVEGNLTTESLPVASTEVRLSSGKDSNTCLGPSLSAAVTGGSFSFDRPVQIGRFSVEEQKDTLCIKDEGVWLLAWHSSYGPAPEHLTFACNKTAGHWTCKANGLESQQ